MANDRTIEIVFAGVDNLSGTLGTISSNVGDFSANIQTVTQPAADAVKAVGKIQTAITAAIGAMAGYSVAAAGEFQQGINEILTLLDPAEVDFEDFTDNIRLYARESTQDMDDILTAAYQGLSQGVPALDLTDFLDTVEELAVVGNATLPEAVDLLASAVNTYGLEMKDLDGLADTFFTVVQDGKTTIPELAAAMGRVSSIAAPLGISVEDVSSALGALTLTMPDTNQAVTTLRAIIQGIVKPTGDAAKAFERFGVAYGADVFENTTLAAKIQEIGEKTGFSAPKISSMFTSVEALAGILPLATDPAGNFATILGDMDEKSGLVAGKFEDMVKNIDLVKNRIENALKGVFISAGLGWEEEAGALADSFIALLNSVAEGIDNGAADPLLDYFGGLMEDIADTFGGLAELIPEAMEGLDYDRLIESFEGLQQAVVDLFESFLGEDIDLSTAEGVQAFLQGFLDGLATVNESSTGILRVLGPAIGALGDALAAIGKLDSDTIETIFKTIGSLFLINIAAGFVTRLSGVVTAVAGLGTAAAAFPAAAMGAVTSSIAGFLALGAVSAGGTVAVQTAVTSALNGIASALTDAGSFDEMLHNWINPDEPFLTRDQIEEKLGVQDMNLIELILEGLGITNNASPELPENMIIGLGLGEALQKVVDETENTAEDVANVQWELDKDGNLVHSAGEITDEVALKLAELESEETIVKIKTEADIDIAEIEAQTQRVVAALELEGLRTQEVTKRIESMYDFNSKAVIAEADKVTSAFEATASSIVAIGKEIGGFGSLFGELGEAGDLVEQSNVKGWIDEQLRQQGELVASQARLADAQSKLAELKISRLESGEALIQIDSTGLEPALEQVMWSIMEKVQLRVAMEEAELLVGLGAEVTGV